MIRRYAVAIVLAGGLATGAVAAVANAGTSHLAAQSTTGSSLASAMLASSSAAGTPVATTPSTGARNGDHGRLGRGLTVTGISGNTISATGRGGQAVAVVVSASTTYTQAGASASLSDIHAGSVIAVQGTSTTASTTTITATSVAILLPSQDGVVSNVNGNTLTVTDRDGATHTIIVSGTTRYQKAGQDATLADITAGTAIMAEGSRTADGSLAAVRVTIRTPRIDGQITAVNGASYTITGRDGATYTVVTTGSTSYANADGTAATASVAKVGVSIDAEGSLSTDGKTLTALRVSVEPAGAGHDGGPHGGHGDGDGAPGAAPVGTPSTSGTATF